MNYENNQITNWHYHYMNYKIKYITDYIIIIRINNEQANQITI